MDTIHEFIIPKKQLKTKIHLCDYCGKSFKRKTYFEKHILVCEQLKQQIEIKHSRNVLDADLEEAEDVLNIQDLTSMVQLLMKKCETMEQEIKSLKSHLQKKTKHISILDWLNDTIVLEKDFLTWINDYDVSKEETEYVFQNDFILGLIYVLQRVFPIEKNELHPIRCFQQKQNIFYIYYNDKKTNINTWKVMDETIFSCLVMSFIQKFLKWFYVWKEENIDKIQNNDDFHDLYVLYMRRCSGTTKNEEQIHRSIRSKLYMYLKQNIKNVIEYEYSF